MKLIFSPAVFFYFEIPSGFSSTRFQLLQSDHLSIKQKLWITFQLRSTGQKLVFVFISDFSIFISDIRKDHVFGFSSQAILYPRCIVFVFLPVAYFVSIVNFYVCFTLLKKALDKSNRYHIFSIECTRLYKCKIKVLSKHCVER